MFRYRIYPTIFALVTNIRYDHYFNAIKPYIAKNPIDCVFLSSIAVFVSIFDTRPFDIDLLISTIYYIWIYSGYSEEKIFIVSY